MKSEECQMEVDIRNYDMSGAKMTYIDNSTLKLSVPGLSEKRPSVLYGDQIFVTLPGKTHEFSGYVHKVCESDVHLKFHPSFHKYYLSGLPCQVRFHFCRTSIRRAMLGTANTSKTGKTLVFPKKANPVELIHKGHVINSNLNEEQRSAVTQVLNMSPSYPYIIFGPPGTGKTNTLVECIKNILFVNKDAKILLSTPSNSASDLLVQRLSTGVRPVKNMFRAIAYQRRYREVPKEVLPFTSYDSDSQVFALPPASELEKFSIVIVTCVSTGAVWGTGIEPGHFTHICIDEAGQATEPETNITLQFAGPETRVILAGDPKQLGPVIRSKLASFYGLEKSFLERLCSSNPLYKIDPKIDNKRYITRLVRNYRSHAKIFEIPSKLFYDSELKQAGNPALINSLLNIEILPNKKIPIIFHGIEGKDTREGNSPSWFNVDEVIQVMSYVNILLKEIRTNPLRPQDIAIISPYRKQVEKLRTALSQSHFRDVAVGSVEEFQGQERRVIIISTVRSTKNHLESDYAHNLGFLKNPKRFNVAITRAQSLLIVIGNPFVLMEDPSWNAMLTFCLEHKAYIGPEVTPAAEREDELATALSALKIDEDLGQQTWDANTEEREWSINI
eukprot:TRINITY_DN9411_c0_g1_i1.p1 TRINITY_DN9411_c0_g1~~TRINITY_DN9411_c0_g1_i1.p1  ORF type:complete len:616 (+),score=114.53 TRINITY_DN9411_c0_g1_i1:777-2624(+)